MRSGYGRGGDSSRLHRKLRALERWRMSRVTGLFTLSSPFASLFLALRGGMVVVCGVRGAPYHFLLHFVVHSVHGARAIQCDQLACVRVFVRASLLPLPSGSSSAPLLGRTRASTATHRAHCYTHNSTDTATRTHTHARSHARTQRTHTHTHTPRAHSHMHATHSGTRSTTRARGASCSEAGAGSAQRTRPAHTQQWLPRRLLPLPPDRGRASQCAPSCPPGRAARPHTWRAPGKGIPWTHTRKSMHQWIKQSSCTVPLNESRGRETSQRK